MRACIARAGAAGYHTPWTQQRCRRALAAPPALHEAADELVSDHHVEEEDEHGGVHAAARPPRGEGTDRSRCLCAGSKGADGDGRCASIEAGAPPSSRPSDWMMNYCPLHCGGQGGDIGGCCRRDGALLRVVWRHERGCSSVFCF